MITAEQLHSLTDPFGAYDVELLRQRFDVVVPFKKHYVLDCSRPLRASVSKNHQYQARRALKETRVEECADPAPSWMSGWPCTAC